jgi:hypothetical protein
MRIQSHGDSALRVLEDDAVGGMAGSLGWRMRQCRSAPVAPA